MSSVVHHQEDAVEGVHVPSNDDIIELGCENILFHLAKLMHNHYFSYNFLGIIIVIEDVADQFDRHYLTGGLALSLDNLAEGALAHEVKDLVLGLDLSPDLR